MRPSRARTGIVVLLLVPALSGCSAITEVLSSSPDGEVDVFSLEVGDCLMVEDDGSGTVTTSPKVPCEEPHEAEVFTLVNTELDEFPGTEQMFEYAHDACEPHLKGYLGGDYRESGLLVWAYTPTEASWEAGDREVICILSTMDEPLVGSMKGSGR